ncbi:hypothetical protein [Polaromonas sp.]|uniref:hypothetical protein n=1 Tax=Polaromonas sp. TaxID=1869339 RepID=UPI00286BE76C|nr:hypothetical protein [Polaromonas sp.]
MTFWGTDGRRGLRPTDPAPHLPDDPFRLRLKSFGDRCSGQGIDRLPRAEIKAHAQPFRRLLQRAQGPGSTTLTR